jgi:hypothetical protein
MNMGPEPPVVLDDLTRHRLLIAKRAFANAERHCEEPRDESSAIVAVVLFDFAIETVLKTSATALGVARPETAIPVLVRQVAARLRGVGDHWGTGARTLRIRALRNAAQHEARYPNNMELAEVRVYARDAFRDLLERVWGVSPIELDVSRLVRDPRARAGLAEAHDALAKGRLDEAVRAAIRSLENALEPIRLALFTGIDYGIGQGFVMLDGGPDEGRTFFEIFSAMEDQMVLLAAGLNITDMAELWRLVGHHWSGLHAWPLKVQHLSDQQAQRVVEVCSELVLKIEGRVGAISQPYGLGGYPEAPDDEDIEARVPGFMARADAVSDPPLMWAGWDFSDSSPDVRRYHETDGWLRTLRHASGALNPQVPEHRWLLERVEDVFIVAGSAGGREMLGHEGQDTMRRLYRAICLIVGRRLTDEPGSPSNRGLQRS